LLAAGFGGPGAEAAAGFPGGAGGFLPLPGVFVVVVDVVEVDVSEVDNVEVNDVDGDVVNIKVDVGVGVGVVVEKVLDSCVVDDVVWN